MNMENEGWSECSAERPRVLDYAGDPFIRPSRSRIAFAAFGVMLPVFFAGTLLIELLLNVAAGVSPALALPVLVKKACLSVVWASSMFLVVYVPNFARRWQLTGDSVVILNGDAERTVIPWQSVKSITVRGFALLLVTTQRKKHRLFGLLRDDAESIVRAWREAMNR